MFSFFKEKLTKVYEQVTSKITALFNRSTIDQTTLDELSRILLSADTGVVTTRAIINHLQTALSQGSIQSGDQAKKLLDEYLQTLLIATPPLLDDIIMLVGINGSGKTTCTGKLAHRFIKEKKRVLIVAGDTFRAAAVEQVATWATRAGAALYSGTPSQDPSAVVFGACQKWKNEQFDKLIVDTAGRLQTKTQLMQELEKIKRTLIKQLPDKKICTLLVLDAMLGQNSLQQAKLFNEATKLDGIILTKLDGTAKGGIVFAIAQELKLPVFFVSMGEKIDDLIPFDPVTFINQLIG